MKIFLIMAQKITYIYLRTNQSFISSKENKNLLQAKGS